MSIDLIDFKIENGKFVLDDTGDIVIVKGAERVRQQIEFRLSLWAGEWFLDEEFGTRYILRILGKAAVTVDAAVDELRTQVMDVDGVQSILRLDYTFDAASRFLDVDMEVQSEFGLVKYQSRAQLEMATPEDEVRTAINLMTTPLDSRVVVNSYPAHSYRIVGDILAMSDEGEYPVEMVNNVTVGRQLLPPAGMDLLTGDAIPVRATMVSDASIPPIIVGEAVTRITPNTVANSHPVKYVADLSSVPVADTVTFSVFVKDCGYGFVRILLNNAAGTNPYWSATFTLADGSVSQLQNGATAKTYRYGNGWWQLVITGARPADPATAFEVYVRKDVNTESFAGDGVSGMAFMYPQAFDGVLPVFGVFGGDGQQHEAPDVRVLAEYGAVGIRVYTSAGSFFDVDFNGQPDAALPTRTTDFGTAYITRIEYRV